MTNIRAILVLLLGFTDFMSSLVYGLGSNASDYLIITEYLTELLLLVFMDQN